MTITDEIYEAAAIAFYGGPYRDVAKEVHLQALRDAVAAAAPLIEAARLRAFADELVGRRDEIDARTCSATSSDTTCVVSGAAWSWPRAWLAQPLTTVAPRGTCDESAAVPVVRRAAAHEVQQHHPVTREWDPATKWLVFDRPGYMGNGVFCKLSCPHGTPFGNSAAPSGLTAGGRPP